MNSRPCRTCGESFIPEAKKGRPPVDCESCREARRCPLCGQVAHQSFDSILSLSSEAGSAPARKPDWWRRDVAALGGDPTL